MAAAGESELSPPQLAELSALADGTLDSERARALEARIAASPEMSALYRRERWAVEALQQAQATERAPATLRAWIESERASRRARANRARYAVALAAALPAVLLALLLVLPGGAPGAPSVLQAAALAARGPAAPAPAPDQRHPLTELAQNVEAVYFPNWFTRFGWRAVGQRRDRLAERPVLTVYYQWRTARIAYAIVSGPALAQPPAAVLDLDGTRMRTLAYGDHTVIVTWRRAGHTCVLSGTGVTPSELQALAAWNTSGART